MEKEVSKILTPTDKDVRFSFPSAALDWEEFRLEEGTQTRDFQIMDYKDQRPRTFRLYTRNRGHRKPVLTSGWIAFVEYKKLRVGDKVIFSVQQNENGGQLWIRAQKRITLWGKELWADV